MNIKLTKAITGQYLITVGELTTLGKDIPDALRRMADKHEHGIPHPDVSNYLLPILQVAALDIATHEAIDAINKLDDWDVARALAARRKIALASLTQEHRNTLQAVLKEMD